MLLILKCVWITERKLNVFLGHFTKQPVNTTSKQRQDFVNLEFNLQKETDTRNHTIEVH